MNVRRVVKIIMMRTDELQEDNKIHIGMSLVLKLQICHHFDIMQSSIIHSSSVLFSSHVCSVLHYFEMVVSYFYIVMN